MLYRSGIRWELRTIGYALEAFALLNFALAAVLEPGPERTWMAASIALITISSEVLRVVVHPIAGGIALACFAAGTVMFGLKTYSLYYWS